MTAALVTAVLGWWLGSAVVLDVRSRRQPKPPDRIVRVQPPGRAGPADTSGPDAVAVLDDHPNIELH